MAARTLNQVFQDIYDREPAVTSADVLLEFARREADGRHWRPKRQDAADFLRPEGRCQVYKSVPVEWPGRIKKDPQTDTTFDLDLWDGRTQAPDADPVRWVMLLQDRFSRKLYGMGLQSRQTDVLLGAFNALMGQARADAIPDGPAEVSTDAESGFTAHAFRDALVAQGITRRVKTPGREENKV
jgi:transposase InsO family protein